MFSPRLQRLALWLSLLLVASTALAKREEVDLADWAEGPIRYIAHKAELEAFRALDEDNERAIYIARFWGRRDPSPDSLFNEYRQLFWERVQQANRSFTDSTKPGWKTDRGKIWVLYGPPTEVQEDLNLRTDGIATGGSGVLRWIFDRPTGRMDMAPTVVVPFVRDSGGEWRLSYDPQLASVFFDPAAIRDGQDQDIEQYLERANAGPRSQLSVMLDLGRMQEVPPQEQVLLETVETSETYRTHPVETRIERYFHPRKQQTIAVVTIDVTEEASSEKSAMVARFAPLDATQPTRILGHDSFRVAESGGRRYAQGRIRLGPGEYALTVLVADPVNLRTGMYNGRITITQANDRFRLSDVVWASHLESLQYGSLSSHDEAYLVGPFRVVPRFSDDFTPGETLQLFYEIYDGELPLRVSYQLQGQENDGSWASLGRPAVGQQEASGQGWELATSDTWPVGEYRVRIEVEDAQGRRIERDQPFRLVAAPEAPETP